MGPASWPRIKAEVFGRQRSGSVDRRPKGVPADKLRVRGAFQIAHGKRATEATIQHRKDTSPSHMAGD
ncbi:hypothetical protein, partial [Sporolactobacillus inulinus]